MIRLHIERLPLREFELLIALEPFGGVIVTLHWPYLQFMGMDDYKPDCK